MSDDLKIIEQEPSKTAMGVAFLRGLSSIDEREEIRGSDYLAKIFLPEERKSYLNYPPAIVRGRVNQERPGMYEFIIARTKYFDNITERALADNIPQIVFLGAGYDTRPYRYKDLIKDTVIFEVDTKVTQQHKIELLNQANIDIHGKLVFVSTNFNTDNLKDSLLSSGYDYNKKTLFIWEGVSYYLLPQAVDDVINFVRSNSAKGSSIHFDYVNKSADMVSLYGVKELLKYMKTNAKNEATRFSIEKDTLETFLSERGFKLINHMTADDMEKSYLMMAGSISAGKLVPIFCIAHAELVS